MRALKTFMRNRKAEMLGCWECKCRTLQCRRYADEFCNCGDATVWDMRDYALDWFKNSELMQNVTDPDAVLENAETIIDWAWEELRPFYNAVKEWNTFEAYVTKEWLTVDETGGCDDELANTDAAFILYVSAMGAIDCKYLWLDSWSLINATAIADYLDNINAD